MKSEDIKLGDMLMFKRPNGIKRIAVVIGFVRSKIGSVKNRKVVFNKICFIDEKERLRTLVTPSSLLEPLDERRKKNFG